MSKSDMLRVPKRRSTPLEPNVLRKRTVSAHGNAVSDLLLHSSDLSDGEKWVLDEYGMKMKGRCRGGFGCGSNRPPEL